MDNTQSGADSQTERVVGDITVKPPVNAPTNRDAVSKMANLREGLQLPPTKEDIKNHSNRNSPAMGNRVNDVLEFVNNNLEDGVNMTMFML
jgi:hypothetical protein